MKTEKTADHIGIGGAVVSTLVPFGNFIYWGTQKEKFPNAAESALNLGIVSGALFLTFVAFKVATSN